jgi:hypothetical protein
MRGSGVQRQKDFLYLTAEKRLATSILAGREDESKLSLCLCPGRDKNRGGIMMVQRWERT